MRDDSPGYEPEVSSEPKRQGSTGVGAPLGNGRDAGEENYFDQIVACAIALKETLDFASTLADYAEGSSR